MTIYIDTETTGLWRDEGHELVEVAVIDDVGAVLLSTLVNPGRSIPAAAWNIHGITDEMVASAPDADSVRQNVAQLVAGEEVTTYNAEFDEQFLDLSDVAAVHCCMLRYAKHHGQWSKWHGDFKWQPLSVAAKAAGHTWTDGPHRALVDAQACRTVWQWLPDAEAHAAVIRAEREAHRHESRLTGDALQAWRMLEAHRIDMGRDRARANEESVEARRLARLRQAVRALNPAIKAVDPPMTPRSRIRLPDSLERHWRQTSDRPRATGW